MLLSVPTLTLPPLVAAAQNLGLLGALVVVTIVCFLEVTDR